MTWTDGCDFLPVVEASFVPVEGVPEDEEQRLHTIAQMDARKRRAAVRTL